MASWSEDLELDINIYSPGQWFSVTSLKEIVFIVRETRPSRARDLVEYFTRIVCLVLFNDCHHFIWTYVRI